METPPVVLDGARVMAFALLAPPVLARGATLPQVNGVDVGPFAAVAICKYDGDVNIYLFYCDETWNVVTDTCHESVELAKRQAAFEFGGIDSHWQYVDMK